MNLWVPLILVAGAVCAVAAYGLWRLHRVRKDRAKRDANLLPVPMPPRVDAHRTVTFSGTPEFSRRSKALSAQSAAWQAAMAGHGKALAQNGIAVVFFVHGTFVGYDPWGVAESVQTYLPLASGKFVSLIRNVTRAQTNLIMRDQANFIPEYVKLAQEALGSGILCREFRWSSGNHHLARLSGAIDLIAEAGKHVLTLTRPGRNRILLVGHSHAGQVFALFAHMVDGSPLGLELIKLLQEFRKSSWTEVPGLALCRDAAFDFVTLGTPFRYGWPESSAKRLINIVNHRGHPYLAGRRRGVPFTRDGDYIQQWGGLGSDFPATTAQEREMNRRLDALLGVGRDGLLWGRYRKLRLRIPPHGFTMLVDYGDQSKMLPNFLATLFGHGVYTRYDTMEFNFRTVIDALYLKN